MEMERLYTLKEAKRLLGVTTRTIQRWDKDGKIRVVRTVGGRRRIPESEIKRILGLREEREVVGYARVSSSTQRDDLERQRQAIRSYARERGYGDVQVLADVGSGLNEDRRNFIKLLELVAERRVSKVIITHDDRLTRFGFETLRRMFEGFGTSIEVMDDEDGGGGKTPREREELVEDMITVVSHFAGKLYGMRSHRYREVVEGARKLVSNGGSRDHDREGTR
ncbi:MAG: IS607 family transposase [Conexivisphaera sp.]